MGKEGYLGWSRISILVGEPPKRRGLCRNWGREIEIPFAWQNLRRLGEEKNFRGFGFPKIFFSIRLFEKDESELWEEQGSQS